VKRSPLVTRPRGTRVACSNSAMRPAQVAFQVVEGGADRAVGQAGAG
jgi:hypothetical protein